MTCLKVCECFSLSRTISTNTSCTWWSTSGSAKNCSTNIQSVSSYSSSVFFRNDSSLTVGNVCPQDTAKGRPFSSLSVNGHDNGASMVRTTTYSAARLTLYASTSNIARKTYLTSFFLLDINDTVYCHSNSS